MTKYLMVLPLFFFSAYSCSNNVLENIIEFDNPNQKVYFVHFGQHYENLKTLLVNFKESRHCRGQTLAINVSEAATNLALQPQQTFALPPTSLYQLASSSLDEGDITKVQSVLFRFSNQETKWAKFLKGCQFENDKNACCVNVHCHPSEVNCEFDVDDLEQKVQF